VRTLVVIPYIDSDKELAEIALKSHKEMAGVECEVIILEDKCTIGWVQMHNTAIDMFDFNYYCYSCADYAPQQDYLKLAIYKLIKEKRGLCAFNDGKWDGRIASVGVVTRKYYKKYGLFHSGYKSHGADDEITKKAMDNGEFCYEPRAVLAEIIGRREQENKFYNELDQKLYYKRLEKGLI